MTRCAGARGGGGHAGPDVSVITPSSGRPALVRRKLEALARQTAGPERLELVLVDNACPEGVGAAMAAENWPFALRVLRSESRLPAGAARAWAASVARGRWLWWSDDDAVPDDDALERHLAAQLRREGVTIGAIRFVTDAGVFRWRPRRAGPAQVTGVNVMLPRAAYERVRDRLPVLPRPYGGEDTLVALALRAIGVAFSDARDAWVEHHGPLPAAGGDPAKGYDAGFNAAVIARDYPGAAWSLGVHPLSLALKRVALAPATLPAWSRIAPRWSRFERAYLVGALDARRPGSARARRGVPP